MTRTHGVLCAFAHPDDEQFSCAAALVSCVRRGIPVQVLCATRGDAGEISDPALAARENLAEVREQELLKACSILDFERPVLLNYLDGRLSKVPPDELRDQVVGAVRWFKPRVLISFDANGGYGHPDHIAIHRATMAAWEVVGDASHRPDLGAPHKPEKLYATGYRRSHMWMIDEQLRMLDNKGFDLGSVQTIPKEEIGTPDELVTTAVPALDVFELRMAAMFAHRTQFGANTFLRRFPHEIVRRIMAVDSFRRIYPPPAPGVGLPDETDLWDGLSQ